MPTLNWIGKDAVATHHEKVPFHLLKDVPELGCGTPGDGNLIVEGDNLVALKALLPYYGSRVKCIYIDPPYNTGNEGWAYNDNVNSPVISQWLGQVVGREDETLDRHDRWLCMLYPRLVLLQEFLREDGVMFISIDDNELAHLLLIVDEIFGPTNRLATLVWEKGKKGDSKFFSGNHEYIVAVARNKALLVAQDTRWKQKKAGVDQVFQQYDSLKATHPGDHRRIRTEMMRWYRSLPKGSAAKGHKHYNWSDDRGLYFPDNFHGPDDGRETRPRYDIIHPVTGKPCAKPSTGWRWEESRTVAALAEIPPRIHFGPDETTIPNRKTYLLEVSQEPFPSVFYKDGRSATLAVEQLLGKGKFAFPKDAEILADLIRMVTLPGDIVLDSFAGSGTTGEAVLRLDAEGGGSRHFILIQTPFEGAGRDVDSNLTRSITAERVRRVAEGYRTQRGVTLPPVGGGFRYCQLGDPLFDSGGRIRPSVRFAELARHVYFCETGEPLPVERIKRSPFLGEHKGLGIYLLFNGILGDRQPDSGNILTRRVLAQLPPFDGPKVIYCEGALISDEALALARVAVRQIPYEVRGR